MSGKGVVYLVGAGCGDFDLITVRGLNIIKRADVLVYDSLIDARLLKYAPNSSEKISVGKRAGLHSVPQSEINRILVDKASEGKTVVRLKGGDPFVFGRGGEEISSLKSHNIPFCIIPGVTSAVAVPELSGIPVTHRNVSRSFHVITGHTSSDLMPQNINIYAKLDGTLVFLMGLNKIEEIANSLILNGKSPNTLVAVISNGASERSVTVKGTLKNIAELVKNNPSVRSPAVIVVGETAGYDFTPTYAPILHGKTVAITGTRRFAYKLEQKLSVLGASVTYVQELKVNEYKNNKIFERSLKNISDYDVVVLTSVNGAEIFFKKLNALKIDIRRLSNVRFAVIGSGTSEELEKYGIFADLIPEKYTSESLADLLSEKLLNDEKVLILRAEKGSSVLTEKLAERGIYFEDIKTYDVVFDTSINKTRRISDDFLTFASSSGVDAFFGAGYEISEHTKIICIGEVTANTLKKYGAFDYLTAKVNNIDGIVNEILTEVNNEKIQKTQKQQYCKKLGSGNLCQQD